MGIALHRYKESIINQGFHEGRKDYIEYERMYSNFNKFYKLPNLHTCHPHPTQPKKEPTRKFIEGVELLMIYILKTLLYHYQVFGNCMDCLSWTQKLVIEAWWLRHSYPRAIIHVHLLVYFLYIVPLWWPGITAHYLLGFGSQRCKFFSFQQYLPLSVKKSTSLLKNPLIRSKEISYGKQDQH